MRAAAARQLTWSGCRADPPRGRGSFPAALSAARVRDPTWLDKIDVETLSMIHTVP